MVEELVGAIVWLVANGVYLDMKRTGRRGWWRVLAFWFGLPITWVTLIVVREGSTPKLKPPPDDEDGLLAEVRRDRALREELPTPVSTEDEEEDEEA